MVRILPGDSLSSHTNTTAPSSSSHKTHADINGVDNRARGMKGGHKCNAGLGPLQLILNLGKSKLFKFYFLLVTALLMVLFFGLVIIHLTTIIFFFLFLCIASSPSPYLKGIHREYKTSAFSSAL